MHKTCMILAAALFVAGCDEEPGPTVMTVTADTGTVEISANQLDDISIVQEGSDRFLNFRMKSAAASAFSELTAANIGKQVTISVCGRIVSEPFIQEQISGGSGQISGMSAEDIRDVAMELTGEKPCD